MPYLWYGTAKKLTVCGRVLEDPGFRPARERESRWRNLIEFWKRLESDELPGARPWPVDLTDSRAVAEAAAGIVRLDVLVHSAGVGRLGTVADTSADTWRHQFDVNVVAVAELTRRVLPALRAARGRVVLVNSGSGLAARAGWASYAASKFALRAFADALRAEEAANGVRVTSIFPGRTDTEMQRDVVRQEGGVYRPERYLRAESVAGAVLLAVTAPADAALTELVLRPVEG